VHLPVRTVQAYTKLPPAVMYDKIAQDPVYSKMISFVSLYYHPADGQVYCGLTSFKNQILITFDPEKKTFKDLEFQNSSVCERFDVKIHRSLEPDDDGTVLFATAGLHALESHPEAEGGRIFRYHPDSGKIDAIARPVRQDYIQTIALDKKRQVVYGNCYPIGNAFRYEIKTGKTTLMKDGVTAHKARCDKEGNLWGIAQTRFNPMPLVAGEDLEALQEFFHSPGRIPLLFKYNTDDGYQYLPDGLPLLSGHAQSLANGLDVGDGGMYLCTSAGRLYRVDKKTGEVQQIADNIGGRLEGIDYDAERGLLFLGGGSFYQTTVFVVDVEKREVISDFWPVADLDTGERCIIVHALCATKRKDSYMVYLGETDNPNRSGYLWECDIKI
jgi:hypothetical protein